MNEHPAWLIRYGTMTTVVRAPSEQAAFDAFLSARAIRYPTDYSGEPMVPVGGAGQVVPPARSEVTIRRPTEKDRGWIEDSGNPAFIALLRELVPA